ncbi:MAG: hypothetical protein ABI639_12695 [Thermoanaerobaculia bacterium]
MSSRKSSRFPVLFSIPTVGWVAAAVTLWLAGVEIRHRVFGPGPDAPTWIWRDHDLRHVQAADFFAVKEIELASRPPEAEIRILGDSEYILSVNGVRVGSNRYRAGAALDRYNVQDWLVAGRNRLVVELRSPDGAGGFWCELLAGGQQLIRSDATWTIYETSWRGLDGRKPLPPGERPRALGRSPLGRWGEPQPGPLRENFQAALAADEPVPAAAARIHGEHAIWQKLRARSRQAPNLGPLVEFDFGVERTGYLQLRYREAAGERPEGGASPVLLDFGTEPIGAPPWVAQSLFQPVPGAGLYQDSLPRRFRYVSVAGLPGVFRAEVLPVTERAWQELKAPAAPPGGVFGVRPPPSSAPVEHEVWRELERTAGLAVRKER